MIPAGVVPQIPRYRFHHGGVAGVLQKNAVFVKGLPQVIGIGAEYHRIGVGGHVDGVGVGEHAGHGVAQVLVDGAVLRGGHVQVHHHDAAGLQMPLYLGEKLHAGQLKGNGDVLIGVHHDHVKLLLRGGQVRPAVLHRHLHAVRQAEILRGDIGNLFVDLRALHRHTGKVPHAIASVGAGAHAQDHDGAAVVVAAVHARHAGRRQRVVVVHSRQLRVLPLDGLHAEQHVGGQGGLPVAVLHLQIVVDGFVLQRDIILPEGEAVGGQGEAQPHDDHRRHDALKHFLPGEGKVHDADSRQHPGEDQERGRRAHGGNGDEGRHKGADDAADGVQGVQLAHSLAGVVQIVYRELGQGRRHRAQQHTGEGEDHQTRRQRRPDEEVFRHEHGQQQTDARNEPPPHKGNQGDPDSGDEDAAIELVRRVGLVRQLAAPQITDGHGDHDNADDDRPHDLGGAEIRGHQPAGAQLHRHDGHTGEEFGHVEKEFAAQQLVFHTGNLLLLR